MTVMIIRAGMAFSLLSSTTYRLDDAIVTNELPDYTARVRSDGHEMAFYNAWAAL